MSGCQGHQHSLSSWKNSWFKFLCHATTVLSPHSVDIQSTQDNYCPFVTSKQVWPIVIVLSSINYICQSTIYVNKPYDKSLLFWSWQVWHLQSRKLPHLPISSWQTNSKQRITLNKLTSIKDVLKLSSANGCGAWKVWYNILWPCYGQCRI